MKIFKKLGINPTNINLYYQAFTHTSYSNENPSFVSYERLEFLGDAVLELLSSEYIYLTNETMGEGAMTKLRAAIVCEPSLAQCANAFGLSEFIFLGKGESAMGGRKRDSIVSDVLEALIGALYLDGGMEEAKKFVHKYILIDIENKQVNNVS